MMTVGELFRALHVLMQQGYDPTEIVVHTEHATVKRIEGIAFDTSTGFVRMEVRSK